MANKGYSIRIVPNKAAGNLETARRRAKPRAATMVRTIMEVAKSNVVEGAPVGHSNALASGYSTEVRQTARGVRGVLSNPVIYHDIREEGRRPGRMPPPSALIPWVGSKMGVPPGERAQVAFLVARKIGRSGYKGSHHVERGWNRTAKQVRPALKDLGYTIAKDIRGRGGNV